MSAKIQSYIICGTPRSGSTLICEMLAASGVAGRPNSYFRPQDIAWWAEQWGVSLVDGVETPDFDRAYLDAMRREGSAGTGVLGLRIMYSSLGEAERRLNRAAGGDRSAAEALDEAFGSVLYIHLSRQDKLGQAVSLARAEQTGLWHLRADGSVLEGEDVQPEPRYDGARIAAILEELERDDAAWGEYFARHALKPMQLTYEGVTANPQKALGGILGQLGLDPAIAETLPTPTAKMADGLSAEWVARFQREAGKA
ncbi:Stf0 family sulfotransferase [Devosia riboflavina]